MNYNKFFIKAKEEGLEALELYKDFFLPFISFYQV